MSAHDPSADSNWDFSAQVFLQSADFAVDLTTENLPPQLSSIRSKAQLLVGLAAREGPGHLVSLLMVSVFHGRLTTN